MKRPDLALKNTTHGLSKLYPKEYRSWKDMRARCNNPNDSDYKVYGGRGFAIDNSWNDFAVFFSDMGVKPNLHTLDRIDVNGHYCKVNCRWADSKTQANNKRSNHIILWNGVKKTLQQWCNDYSLDHSKVRYRLKQGWPLEKVFSKGDYRLPK